MNALAGGFAPELPSTMQLPAEISQLRKWTESRGWADSPYPSKARATHRDIVATDECMDEVEQRLFRFARIGIDGSQAWVAQRRLGDDRGENWVRRAGRVGDH